MAVRNLSSGANVKELILKETPTAKVDVLELDLSSFASVRKFASEFLLLNLPLNILINNAGIMASPFLLSVDGLELQFATNHVGHFLLTNLLLENMESTSRNSSIEGRIVNVSSGAHKFAYSGGVRFDKINDPSGFNTICAYGQSKLANILHANELSRRFKERGTKITANSLHPGTIITNLLRYHSFVDYTIFQLLSSTINYTADGEHAAEKPTFCLGAATTCYVALNPQVQGVSGKYFENSNLASPNAKATDPDLAKKLWDFSMALVG
ncbi:unnamed protein product [Spirodela intermedia]|uniref:Uncharacterized protein n=1 Tax=Spirodela intermedia TaxID=51605 RepID=A0A7I8IDV2_SPIIN|nr:unnamed protein product [Spirodela intermedia]CAA6655574.1 unnamed protein product [Spirodela intermedia]